MHERGAPLDREGVGIEIVDQGVNDLGVGGRPVLVEGGGEVGERHAELAQLLLRFAAEDAHLGGPRARLAAELVELGEGGGGRLLGEEHRRAEHRIALALGADAEGRSAGDGEEERDREGGPGDGEELRRPRQEGESGRAQLADAAQGVPAVGQVAGAGHPGAVQARLARAHFAHGERLGRDLALVHREVDRLGEDHIASVRVEARAQGELDRIAGDVVRVHLDLAEADGDADLDAIGRLGLRVPGAEAILHGHRAEDRIGGRAEGDEQRVADRFHLVAAESLHHRQEERVVKGEHARVLLARLPAGAGGEALHVREDDGEVLRPRRGPEQPADLVGGAHSAPRIWSSASRAAVRLWQPRTWVRMPSCGELRASSSAIRRRMAMAS